MGLVAGSAVDHRRRPLPGARNRGLRGPGKVAADEGLTATHVPAGPAHVDDARHRRLHHRGRMAVPVPSWSILCGHAAGSPHRAHSLAPRRDAGIWPRRHRAGPGISDPARCSSWPGLCAGVLGGGILTPTTALGVNVLGVATAFCVGTVLLLRTLPTELRWVRPEYATREWIRASIPMMLITGSGCSTIMSVRWSPGRWKDRVPPVFSPWSRTVLR